MDQKRGHGTLDSRSRRPRFKQRTMSHDGCGMGHRPSTGMFNEIAAHLPYAILSVSMSIGLMALITFYSLVTGTSVAIGADVLFHIFHYIHVTFSASGTLLMSLRRNSGLGRGLCIATFCSIVFCTLSDSLIPVLGSRMLGVDMHWCLCIVNETRTVLTFLAAGLINGYALYSSSSNRKTSSLLTHFVHVFVSSLASSFYLIAHGFSNWYEFIGVVYIFLIIAVVLPCTISDVIAPLLFTKVRMRDAQQP